MPDKSVIQIEKADLTVTPPGGGTIRFAILEGKAGQPLPSMEKRQQDDIFYDMYVKHPWVRAGIDKKAKVASDNGFMFKPEDQSADLNNDEAKELRMFFRRSGGALLFFQTFVDLQVFGRAYWWLEYKNGHPWKARRLHPKYLDWYSDGREVTKFRYGPVSTEKADEYEVEEVLSFRVPDPNDDLMGLPPLASLQKTVAIDLFAMDYNGSYFENNAQTGIVFQIKGASETELNRNREWLEEHYVGSKNAHRPLLLEGEVTVHKSVATQAEMGFIEGRKMNREEILAVLDVHPEKLGLREDSNRSTAKEGTNSFRTESVRPVQTLVEGPINNVLLLERFEFEDILFSFNEVDVQQEMDNLEVITKAQGSGILNTDEARSRLGYGNVANGGGDIHFIQTSAGLVPLAHINEQAEVALEKEKAGLELQKKLAQAPTPSKDAAPGGAIQPPKPQGGTPGVGTNKER